MLGFEAGTCNGSDLYFQSPSEQARSMLFYMTSCGYYYTDKDYRIDRSRYPDARYLLMYIRSGRLSVTANHRTIIAPSSHTAGSWSFWTVRNRTNTIQ